MAGVTVFLFLMIVYFIFTSNLSVSTATNFNELYNDASVLSETLISAGIPENWNESNVKEAGITNGDYRLNVPKLKNLSVINYSSSKSLLKTRFDYIVFFENKNGDTLNISGTQYIGKSGVTKDNLKEVETPSNLVSIRRFLIYNSDIIIMVAYLWE